MTKSRCYPRMGLLVLVGLIILGYSVYQARFLILGPRVEITSPAVGATLEERMITIEGEAANAAWISLNDRQIFTDENGYWSEKLIAQPGASIMSVKARDRFGRETEERLEIFVKY